MRGRPLRWSEPVRVLLRPRDTFADLIEFQPGGRSLVARPLLFVFVLGCAISVLASGRLSVRLILDGMVSFAFVPVIGAASLGIVSRYRSMPAMPLAQMVDLFFVGNAPWLLWFTAVGTIACLLSPQTLGGWITPALIASLLPLTWSASIDFCFFQTVMRRSSREAGWDLLLHRGIAWTAILVFFVGPEKLTQRLGEFAGGIF